MDGLRLGVYVFKDAEIIDFAAPHSVLSVARRFASRHRGKAAPETGRV